MESNCLPLKPITHTEDGGRVKRSYTTVTAQLSSRIPGGLMLYHEGIFQKLGKTLGGEDVQVGDDALDTRFITKGDNSDAIRCIVCSPRVKSQ